MAAVTFAEDITIERLSLLAPGNYWLKTMAGSRKKAMGHSHYNLFGAMSMWE